MSSMKFKVTSAANTTPILVKQQGGNLTGLVAINTNAAIRYLKFYDSSDAAVVGTTVPVITIQLPASSQTTLLPMDGIAFRQSLYLAFTVNVADTDNTAVGAGDVIMTVFYE